MVVFILCDDPINPVHTKSNPPLHSRQPCLWPLLKGWGNSLLAFPWCVCWYYQQTVWLCLSECDDRTKHWYLPCDNRRVWTGSVEKLGVWDWHSLCVYTEAWCTISIISAWVCTHRLWQWLWQLLFVFCLCWVKTSQIQLWRFSCLNMTWKDYKLISLTERIYDYPWNSHQQEQQPWT